MSARSAARALVVAPREVPGTGRWRKAGAENRPALRVVEPPEDEPTSIIGRVGVTLLVLLFASVFALVVFQAVLAQSQRSLDDLRRDLAHEEEQAKVLRLQVAMANAPDRVAAAAETRLGLVPPDEIVYLEPGATDDAAATYDPAEATTTTTTAPATDGGSGVTTTTYWSPSWGPNPNATDATSGSAVTTTTYWSPSWGPNPATTGSSDPGSSSGSTAGSGVTTTTYWSPSWGPNPNATSTSGSGR